jgi:hypothetical protein
VNGEPVKLARQTDGEVGDVDHLLDFALAFGANLPALHRDERAERRLLFTKRVADLAHDLAALWRGHDPPDLESPLGGLDGVVIVRGIGH